MPLPYVRVLPEAYLKSLKHYIATGNDLSITRQYILNHFYEAIMKIMPLSIAPNMITLVGFICIVLSATVTSFYAPTLTETLPSWVFVLNAFCLFTYQTLDNLDGKQARRTGTSSPLGEMFDHGLDALSCSFGTYCWLATCAQGGTYTTFAIILCTFLPFMFATWEEYYVGGLYLGYLNGPIEGILSVIGTQLVAAQHGQQFFHQSLGHFVENYISSGLAKSIPARFVNVELWLAISSATFVLALFNSLLKYVKFFAILTNYSTINVFNRIRQNRNSPHAHGSTSTGAPETNFLNALVRLLPFVILLGGFLTWIILSPTNIMKQHPYLIIYTSGIAFGYLSSNLTLAYLLKSPLKRFSFCLIPITLALANLAVAHITGYATNLQNFNIFSKVYVNERYMLYICAIWVSAMYYNFVMSVCFQISGFLGFNILTIKPKDKSK
jgi:ethanolaminephosphotransferase